MPIGEVNVGPMKCSKTELAVILANKLMVAVPDAQVLFVKSNRDTRDADPLQIRSRSGGLLKIPATIVASEAEVFERGKSAHLVVVDEGHMFRPTLAPILMRLATQFGVHCMYFGLDTTWRGQHFATTAAVCPLPGFKVYKHKAYCELCKLPSPQATATWSQKLRDGLPVNILDEDEPTFEVGDAQYRPLCTKHWFSTTPGSPAALAQGRIGIIDPQTEWPNH